MGQARIGILNAQTVREPSDSNARIGILNTQVARERASTSLAMLGVTHMQVLRKMKSTSTANVGVFDIQVARIREGLYVNPSNKTLTFDGRIPFVANWVDQFEGTNSPAYDVNWDMVSPVLAPHTFVRNNKALVFNCVDGGPITHPIIKSRFYVDGDFDVVIDTSIQNPGQQGYFAWSLWIIGETQGEIQYNGARWYGRNRWHINENGGQVDWWDHDNSVPSAQMRIVRSGNNFTYYYDSNNNDWHLRGTRALTVSNRVFFQIHGYYDTVSYPAEVGRVHYFAVKANNLAGFGSFYPAEDALVFTGYAPTISSINEVQWHVPAGSLAFTGYAPDQEKLIEPAIPACVLTFTTYAPSPGVGQVIAVDTSTALAFTGYAPIISANSLNYDDTLGMLSISIEN